MTGTNTAGLYRACTRLTHSVSDELELHPNAADTGEVKVIYVETCPECSCALVRSPEGERRSSNKAKRTVRSTESYESKPAAPPPGPKNAY